jgi:hypothetical protein
MSTALRLAKEAQAMFEAADKQNRALTADERIHVDELLDRAKDHHEMEKKVRDLGHDLGAGIGSVHLGEITGGGPGERFVKAQEYLRIKDPGSRGQNWSTGPIQVSDIPLSAKGTLLEPGVGGPGGGLVAPYYQPGAVSKLFEPLSVANVFGSSQVAASQGSVHHRRDRHLGRRGFRGGWSLRLPSWPSSWEWGAPGSARSTPQTEGATSRWPIRFPLAAMGAP